MDRFRKFVELNTVRNDSSEYIKYSLHHVARARILQNLRAPPSRPYPDEYLAVEIGGIYLRTFPSAGTRMNSTPAGCRT